MFKSLRKIFGTTSELPTSFWGRETRVDMVRLQEVHYRVRALVRIPTQKGWGTPYLGESIRLTAKGAPHLRGGSPAPLDFALFDPQEATLVDFNTCDFTVEGLDFPEEVRVRTRRITNADLGDWALAAPGNVFEAEFLLASALTDDPTVFFTQDETGKVYRTLTPAQFNRLRTYPTSPEALALLG